MSQEGVRPELGSFPTRQTAEGNEPAVGEASQRILLLLSSGQSLSIHEISRALGLTMEMAWKDLALLEQGKQIILSDGRIQRRN